MRSDSIFKHFLLGIVLAAVLMPVPAKAQWTVFDPANYGLQLKKQLEDLNRWIVTINQYTQIYENAVGQLTNLKSDVTSLKDDVSRVAGQVAALSVQVAALRPRKKH